MHGPTETIRACRHPLQRARGFLFTRPGSDILVFPGCSHIHTHLMKYDLDVAFIDKAGQVMSSFRGVAPGCRLRHPRAWAVIERAASPLRPWYEKGSYVDVAILRAAQGKE